MQNQESHPALPPQLYRYMSIDKFLHMVLLQKLTLTRIDCFDDPNEGALRADDELRMHIALSTAGTSQEPASEIFNGQALVTGAQQAFMQSQLHRTLTFASCWTERDHDSAALWSNYASQTGVCIRVPTNALRQAIAGVAHGDIRRIIYRPLDKPIRIEADHLTPATLKEGAYEYEREVRVLVYDHIRGMAGYDDWRVVDKEGQAEIRTPRHQHIDFAPDLIEEVVISPYGHTGHEASIRRLAELLGVNWHIRKSRMLEFRGTTPEEFRESLSQGEPYASPRLDAGGLHVRTPVYGQQGGSGAPVQRSDG